MLGPEGAASHAVAWLAERIPDRLRVLEARYQLDAGSLPNPAQVLDHERGPIAVEDWPAVFVLPQRVESIRLVEVRDDSSEVYLVTYALRVLAWVRSDGYQATDQLRKRYVLAIREALLERKSLSPAPTYGSGDYGTAIEDNVVDPSSIREDYSDVMVDEAKRTIAGAWIDVNLIVAEVLEAAVPLGTALGVDVREQPAAPHPGL